MENKLTKEQIGLESISPSKLQCYEECPLNFYYSVYLGIQLPESKLHMDFGTAVHEAIHEIYLQYDDHFGGSWEAASFDRVKKRFLKNWKPSMVTESMLNDYSFTRAGRDNGFVNPKQLYDYFKDDGIKMLESYWKEKEMLLVDHGHDLKHFEVPNKTYLKNPFNPEEQLPIPLSYRLDAATREWDKIVDFKTSGSKYNQEETHKKIQGRLYLLAHLSETGKFISDFDYTVLRKQLVRDERIEVVNLKYTMDDMMETYLRVEVILQKIANKEFYPPTRGHPSWCRCRNYQEALKVN